MNLAFRILSESQATAYNRERYREDRPMAVAREELRDWHRLFGLLLTDFFTGSPFTVEVERDLSTQQQFLDVAIVRRGRGRFVGRLPTRRWTAGPSRS
jgi:hypothetical protein